MRTLSRIVATVVLVGLAVGPLIAAPILPPASTVTIDRPAPASPASSAAKWLVLSTLAIGGAITMRDTGALANKYVTRAGQAAGDYKDGVTGAGGRFEANAKANEGNYEQGVQAAIGRKAYGKGIAGSGGKYEKNAVALGATRYAPGVQNAKDAWSQGFQPYADRLKSLDLPPKGPRRSPANQQRSNAVAMALGALKEGK